MANKRGVGKKTISKLDGCYKDANRRNFFYRSGILDEKAMKRKWSTKIFLKSQVLQIQKEHKMSIPNKTICLNRHKMSNPIITGEL